MWRQWVYYSRNIENIRDTETFCDAESLCSLTTAVNVDRKTQAPETWRNDWNLVRKLTNFD